VSVAESTASQLEIRNPVTGELVGTVPVATRDSVRAAVTTARSAQPDWQRAGLGSRREVIRRFVRLLDENEDEILDTLQGETGKTRRDALSELLTVVRTGQYYDAHAAEFLEERSGAAALPGLTKARTVLKPHGVVGFITPWNYPFLLSIGDAIPALLAGNAVVVKPSELTPLSAEVAFRLLQEAGAPSDIARLVHGPGEIGSALVAEVDYVSFTGSAATGRKIAIGAGERLIPYSLELGGKNPLIVLAGAPVDRAVEGFVAGAFFNSGQTCIAVERAFIDRPIFDEFVSKSVEQTKSLKLGWSNGWSEDMGSLISAAHARKVLSHIEDARTKGADVLIGGKPRADLGPAFVEPTLLAEVSEDAELYREETFGPVVALYPVDGAEEAIQRANDTPYGLNASIWGPNDRGAVEVARRIETGSAAINSSLLIYHCFGVPMGGVKQSGVGRRHGRVGIQRFTQTQSIVSGPTLGGGYDTVLNTVTNRRAASLMSKMFHWRGKIPGLR
jgi:succinate-semialdehyde dehydrogenase/glutarate-semialdehyde dehydrogenase